MPTVQVQVRGIDANTGLVSTLTRWVNVSTANLGETAAPAEPLSPGPASEIDSLVELLDGVILLYNVAAHKQLHKVRFLYLSASSHLSRCPNTVKLTKVSNTTFTYNVPIFKCRFISLPHLHLNRFFKIVSL